MRVKRYGLLFDYEGTKESEMDNIAYINNYVEQTFNNFVLVNYFLIQKSLTTYKDDGFQNISQQFFIELFMIDTNPRKLLYDKKSDKIYYVNNTEIAQELEPNRRRLYTLPLQVINEASFKIDTQFIRDKFNQMWEVYNGFTR